VAGGGHPLRRSDGPHRRAQEPGHAGALRRVASGNGWKRSTRSEASSGDDRVGAVHRHSDRLAEARINVVANSAVGAGKGRYRMILWVKPKDYARAARALGAR
jgi:hypothetical protein